MLNSVVSLIGGLLGRKIARDRLAFHHSTMRPREVQHEFLLNLIRRHAQSDFGRDHCFHEIRSAAEYRRQMKVACYDDFAPYIQRVVNGQTDALFCDEQVIMFSLTSGTSNSRKFIPVTRQYLADYRRGWSMWGLQTFEQYPRLFLQPKVGLGSAAREFMTKAGVPCGSLSGLTANMNPGVVRRTYCLPSDTADYADAPTRCYLNWRVGLHRDLGMCVTPNPGLMLQFARFGHEHSDRLIREVHDGGFSCECELPRHLQSWLKSRLKPNPRRAAELESIRSKTGRLYPVDVWPNLQLLACWLGGPTRAYLRSIPEYFGNVSLRDIGLISSESRMSLPKEDNTPGGILDVTSAFFEFIPVDEVDSLQPTILEAADLQTGGEYYILLTTSSGLYRYNIQDVIRVIDWHEQTPIIEFLHKGSRIANLFGEKLTESQIVRAVEESATDLTVGDYAIVLPAADERVAYRALVEFGKPVAEDECREFARRLDESLGRQNYLYERKRREGLLEPLQLDVIPRGSWRAWDIQQLSRTGGTMDQYKHPFLITDRSLLEGFNAARTGSRGINIDGPPENVPLDRQKHDAQVISQDCVQKSPDGPFPQQPAKAAVISSSLSTTPSSVTAHSQACASSKQKEGFCSRQSEASALQTGIDAETVPTERRPYVATDAAGIPSRYVQWLGVSLACQLSITWTLHRLAGLAPQTSFLISLLVMTCLNYLALRRFVFRAVQQSPREQLAPYILMNIVHRAGEMAGFALIYQVANPSVLVAVPVVLGLSTLIRYFVYSKLVFVPAHRTAP